MPRVVVESADGARIVAIDAPDGGALGDLCDDTLAPVVFSCRTVSCGVCRVEVLEGAARLAPARADELEVLARSGDRIGDGADGARPLALPVRLACCAVVLADDADDEGRARAPTILRLRAVKD